MGMTIPAGTENRVIKRLTCSWEMFSAERISGRTGISMELPSTMSKGMKLDVRRTTHQLRFSSFCCSVCCKGSTSFQWSYSP